MARKFGTIEKGDSCHPLYSVWHTMISRCHDKKSHRYKYYGDRGIKVCGDWFVFGNFIKDVMPTYNPGMSIDRKDNDGDYEVGNFRWATRKEQANNTRTNVKIKDNDGVFHSMSSLSEKYGIPHGTIWDRNSQGLSFDKIVCVKYKNKQKYLFFNVIHGFRLMTINEIMKKYSLGNHIYSVAKGGSKICNGWSVINA